MCGIVGAVRVADRETVTGMTRLLAHRGPDDEGIFEDGETILGHRRLSILDPTPAGHQPMCDDTGELAITYNGEIYNYRELRAELERRGHRFHTDTDTEVLLVGYREYGPGVLEHIEGIFAFGLWDARDGSLLLARDRSGVKPLFYHVTGEGIAFASELKALRLLPGFVSRPNRRALRSAMRYACNLEDESMLAGVFKLPPGEWLRWKDGRIERGAYWRHPEPLPLPWREEELAIELRARLQRVVEQQMVSDVPLGAALSGGLDSSGIVALMARTGRPVHAFTVGHGENDPDLVQARVVAEHTGADLHELLIESQDVAELLPRVVWFLEEPLGQMESVQMYANYGAAAAHVKVLLVGEGADELFAGYDRYRLLARGLPLPRAVRNELYERVYMYADRQPHGLISRAVARAAWGRLPGSPMADPVPRAPGPPCNGKPRGRALGAALHHDRRTYLHHLSLKRADATGMAHGLELRVPYLGREIVELAATIPDGLLLRGGVEKYCLRRALAPLLPEAIVRRRKRPFQMALDDGLVRTMDDLCDLLLRPEDVAARGFFEPARVAALRRGRPGKRAPYIAHKVWSYRVWAMLAAEVWARLFLDRPPAAGAPSGLAAITAS